MSNGLIVELSELIGLKRYSSNKPYSLKTLGSQAGNHLSTRRGRGMDISEVRNYQAGDEIRHMEWRVTARTGRPHIKIYQEELEKPVVLLVDFNPSMFFGTKIALKSVIAARLAALISWTAGKQGDKIGGLLFSAEEHFEFTPRARNSGILPLLAGLSQLTKPSLSIELQAKPMENALDRLRRVVKPGSIVVIISDFYSMNSNCEQHLASLRRHNQILAYHICDPLELAPPKPGQYPMTDGKQEILLDTRIDNITQNYAHYFQQRVETLEAQCKRLLISYNQVRQACDLVHLVRTTFPRRVHG